MIGRLRAAFGLAWQRGSVKSSPESFGVSLRDWADGVLIDQLAEALTKCSPDLRYYSGRKMFRFVQDEECTVCVLGLCRRAQVLLLCDRLNYDRSIATPGMGSVRRYFTCEFDRLSGAAGRSEAVKVD
jgi:hypothetical protein